jgi:hypothetical protein
MQLAARGGHAVHRCLQDTEDVDPGARETPGRDEDQDRQRGADQQDHRLLAGAALVGLAALSPADEQRPPEDRRPEHDLDAEDAVPDVEEGVAGERQHQRGEEPGVGGEVGERRAHALNRRTRSARWRTFRQWAPSSSRVAVVSAASAGTASGAA